jgi:purine nucleoside phosphorylase
MTQNAILNECFGVSIGIIGGSGLYGIDGIKVVGGLL